MSNPSQPDLSAKVKTDTREKTSTRRVPPFHVILENDPFHSFEFVVDTISQALGYSTQRSYQLTLQAHHGGQSVVWTGSREVAELKVEQIQTFHEIRESDGAKL